MGLKTGIVGCGNISGIYIENSRRFRGYEVTACADLDDVKAMAAAEKHGLAHLTVKEMMESPDIDAILNLTVPHAHAIVSLDAIRHGKHVYSEKPLATSFKDGIQVIEAADLFGVTVGSAPDTFLGGSIQLGHRLIEEGAIGELVGAAAFMMSRGPESWHPNPGFFYQPGGGPMYDMGPYYLSALISIFGPVSRVAGSASITFRERMITSPEQYGEKIKVKVPTHINGILDFAHGGSATITTSFDVTASRTPFLELYGELGTISFPDPNYFNQPVLIKKHGEEGWTEMQPESNPADNLRGIGLSEMAIAIEKGTKPRASGELGLHVLEVMAGFHQSSETGKHYQMESNCEMTDLLDADDY